VLNGLFGLLDRAISTRLGIIASLAWSLGGGLLIADDVLERR